jgi:hypothetical protein
MHDAILLLLALYSIIVLLMAISRLIRHLVIMHLVGFALSIPLGYALGPVFAVAEATPHHIATTVLQFAWIFAIVFVIGYFIDDWADRRGRVADQQDSRSRPTPLLLRDLAPWLQSVPIAEDEDAAPALSPPRKNLPAPARD